MTRYTDFGRKRTYLEAGFSDEKSFKPEAGPSTAISEPNPSEKKRKRSKRDKKLGFEGSADSSTSLEPVRIEERDRSDRRVDKSKPLDKKRSASEARRRKRITERVAGTTCLACRKKGHLAKNCPSFTTKDRDADIGQKEFAKVGLCYRCGSHNHSLAKCKAPLPSDPSNLLPFASCFVCSGRGHLASQCPENKERGVYPNGGACLLCKEVTHLAKDCPLRRRDNPNNTLLVGTGSEAGADEDDFHVIGRVREELIRKEGNSPGQPKEKNKKAQKNAEVTFQPPKLVQPISEPKKVIFFKG